MAPSRFLGSESKFAKPLACPKGSVRRTAAKLASDPNNRLPPKRAHFFLGRPGEKTQE